MPSQSNFKIDLTPDERRDFGFIRIRDIAFDAVQSLWRRRQTEGMTQADLASAINADAAWVSKNLRGPGNWTLRTFGAFVEALHGEAQITVRAIEDPLPIRANSHAYVDYDPVTTAAVNTLSRKPPDIARTTTSMPLSASRAAGRLIMTLSP
jgi:transcriptional regulator with XRE-family HTH domain